MALPRSAYVQDGVVGVYHCFTRCVRRAFLNGFDPVTGRDFSHRKTWLVDRLRWLAAIFAVDVCAYAVMDNHYHTILRTRPDIVATWSDRDVAIRWLTLFPHRGQPPDPKHISVLAHDLNRIALYRKRLSSLSWFVAQLNEFIARAANKEDNVKGRYWESRFKCLDLLDDAAIAACMVYVDLNPIRAGLAASPEQSNFTSIQQRIRAWQSNTIPTPSLPTEPAQNTQPPSLHPSDWLCPIQSHPNHPGILPMTDVEYLKLVDTSGRILRSDKGGAVDPHLAPILLRIGANPQAWNDTVSHFASKFRLAAGLVPSLRSFACLLGRRWFTGITAARHAFAPYLPQLPASINLAAFHSA